MSGQSRLVLEPGVGLAQIREAAERGGWYIDDYLIDVPYLLIHGEDRERAIPDVREAVPSYGMDRAILEALAARTSNEKSDAIRRIAVLGGKQAPDFAALQLFDAAFIDPDPEIRKLAVRASTYPQWQEFEPRLEIVARGDQDQSVRELANRALASMREHAWK